MKILIVSMLILFLFGCGPGLFDYSEELENSGYFYSSFDSSNRYIWKKDNGIQKNVVDRNVVEFHHSPNYLVAVRQVTQSYDCNGGSIANEYKKNFEYWIIDLKEGEEFGPLSYDEYLRLFEARGLPDSFSLKPQVHYQNIHPFVPLLGCGSPKLIPS